MIASKLACRLLVRSAYRLPRWLARPPKSACQYLLEGIWVWALAPLSGFDKRLHLLTFSDIVYSTKDLVSFWQPVRYMSLSSCASDLGTHGRFFSQWYLLGRNLTRKLAKLLTKSQGGENLILPAVRTEQLRTILPKIVAERTLHHREKSHANRLWFERVVSVGIMICNGEMFRLYKANSVGLRFHL